MATKVCETSSVREHLQLGIDDLSAHTYLRDDLLLSTAVFDRFGGRIPLTQPERVRARLEERAEKWIPKEYPQRLTSYDVINMIKVKMEEDKITQKSVCEVISHRTGGRSGRWSLGPRIGASGKANAFLSHTQGEPFGDTLLAMATANGRARFSYSTVYLWVDIFSLRQGEPDEFKPGEIVRLIHDIGNTFVAVDRDRTYFRRSFCTLESYASTTCSTGSASTTGDATSASKTSIILVWATALSSISSIASVVDSENAKSRKEADEIAIRQYIADGAGHAAVNDALTSGVFSAINGKRKEIAFKGICYIGQFMISLIR